MKITNLTWLGFLMTLSSLAIVPETKALNTDNVNNFDNITENIESRLNRISEALKIREKDLPPDNDIKNYPDEEILLGQSFLNSNRGGWGNGGRNWRNGGSFLNNNRGGSFINQPRNFLNNRGWGDGGGFWNRR
ncbi:MAG: rSAM-associated Gly-rich repeat protein [Cyanobacteria bacterium]|nr:rSAM-associated Gly-rich repeat protein [Cyanobacteria bacterium CG_2015-16_32_12]NCO79117.1 rSAM-associated Gly-rich repeat protein [Cyanobacteria bacterium CG_2015-22_32_23]NCQ03694.1 rSAM-associated Gly-rich repeat protein [Cyanobacteria bacterium CG_2015-09_32_10]NCQ40464.1 rSAM-associated Gly-rich repeat protein [Cyanobacteria bacterium CG_2015-04_32_10]NCS84941.1 rSAM-associated Gly-rich repeat protein [Cyanobacteria bacterium CG_2015-02_32_10]